MLISNYYYNSNIKIHMNSNIMQHVVTPEQKTIYYVNNN